jgi:hypothetical protein
MGLIGLWGEHHTPDISPQMQKIMGDAFTAAFKNKKVTVRHPWDFSGYPFRRVLGLVGTRRSMATHGEGIIQARRPLETQVIGGNRLRLGNYKTQRASTRPTRSRQTVHREFLINSIRRLHGNYIGWVAAYDRQDEAAVAGAAQVQAALGLSARHNRSDATISVAHHAGLRVTLTFVMTLDAFYADWPLEVSLLDVKTRQPVWKNTFAGRFNSSGCPATIGMRPHKATVLRRSHIVSAVVFACRRTSLRASIIWR